MPTARRRTATTVTGPLYPSLSPWLTPTPAPKTAQTAKAIHSG